MQVGQKIFRLVGLKTSYYRIKEIKPTNFLMENLTNGKTFFLRNLNDQQQTYYVSEVIFLNEYKERLEKTLKKTIDKIEAKKIAFNGTIAIENSSLEEETRKYNQILKDLK